METAGLTDLLRQLRNRAEIVFVDAPVVAGRQVWDGKELCWGIWNSRESDLRLVEGVEPDSDVIELGCGTAAISAWLARRDIRLVAVDFSRAQLETASDSSVSSARPFL